MAAMTAAALRPSGLPGDAFAASRTGSASARSQSGSPMTQQGGTGRPSGACQALIAISPAIPAGSPMVSASGRAASAMRVLVVPHLDRGVATQVAQIAPREHREFLV